MISQFKKISIRFIGIFITFFYLSFFSYGQMIVTGVAFIDKNSNGLKDRGEKAFSGLHISNGRDIVSSDKQGKYTIEKLKGRFVFAIKPADFQFDLDEDFQPRFYHSGGSEVFNVALRPSNEDRKFSLVLMGDPQVYAQDQINYLGQVATDELLRADHEFMITLGDLVGNALPLLPQVKTTLGLARKPSYYAIGNHDRDRGNFPDPTIEDNNSYEEAYGPDYYSFNWGNVHVLVLNDVLTKDRNNGKGSDYVPGIHVMQEQFIVNDLAQVSPDKLILVCAHIPFFLHDKKTEQTKKMIALLQNHPKVFMATGHAHNQIQLFFDEDEGWNHEQAIHQLVAGAICGGWWRGEPDIYGVPGSMMRDGTPPGYWFMHVDDTDYQLEYKVSGRGSEKQMHIWVPYFNEQDTVMSAKVNPQDIWVNVYAGNEFTEVQMRLDQGKWQTIKRKEAFDPYILHLLERQEIGRTPTPGVKPLKPEPRASTHLWYAQLPENLESGAHIVEVKAKNKFGLDTQASRVIWKK